MFESMYAYLFIYLLTGVCGVSVALCVVYQCTQRNRKQRSACLQPLCARANANVLILDTHGKRMLVRRGGTEPRRYGSAVYCAFEQRERAVARLTRPVGCAQVRLRFVSVLSREAEGGGGGVRFAADARVADSFDWLFFSFCSPLKTPDECEWLSIDELLPRAYDGSLAESLALPLRLFAFARFAVDGARASAGLLDNLRVLHKESARLMPDPRTASVGYLRDVVLLDSCLYTFDRPGKGVRSRLVRALARHFDVSATCERRLCNFVEQFHQLSLVIDDIQDGSELRRNRACSHRVFGTPESIGAAYLQLFRLLSDIPRAFPVRSAATAELVLDGCRACQRGQALDVTWRERRYCPSRAEWTEMVRGKTGAPFELVARLVALQGGPLMRARLCANRCAAWAVRLLRWPKQWAPAWLVDDVEEAIVELCGALGVFFQMRDDFINLADEQYWRTHGCCDDLHEKKFSYPIVLLVENKLAGFDRVLSLYRATSGHLDDAQIAEALAVVQASGVLQMALQDLQILRDSILRSARRLQMSDVHALIEKLSIPSAYVPPAVSSASK